MVFTNFASDGIMRLVLVVYNIKDAVKRGKIIFFNKWLVLTNQNESFYSIVLRVLVKKKEDFLS